MNKGNIVHRDIFLFLVVSVTVPFFDGRASFLSYPPLTNSFSMTFLYLEVRPAAADGIVLLNTQLGGPDFIAIAMRGGRVELWYDLGQGPVSIVSIAALTLNEWHSIQVFRAGRDGQLIVDDAPAVSGRSPQFFTLLQISSDLYLGAAPLPPSLPVELRVLNGFNGCIRVLRTSRFASSPVDLIADALSGLGVEECPNVDVCRPDTCSNGGTCVNTVDSFLCRCEAGFTGVRCEVDLCVTNNPCRNNGACYAETRGGEDLLLCNCSAPFSGQNCTESKYYTIAPLLGHVVVTIRGYLDPSINTFKGP